MIEAARNLACVGAVPKALVNCLNFGNPEHPEVMWQFSEVVDGMSEACRALGIPVVGGNVSFYNESRGADIDPTPGRRRRRADRRAHRRAARRSELHDGDAIVVLGHTDAELGGSEWADACTACAAALPPAADLDGRRRAARLRARRWSSARDGRAACTTCSDGGLAVALAEMADRRRRPASTCR